MSNIQTMDAHEHAAGKTGWTKSAYSDHGNACVEWQFEGEKVLVRDSKYRGDEEIRPIINVPADAWATFLAVAVGDAPSLSTMTGVPHIKHDPTSAQTVLTDAAGTALTFTANEWEAFTRSIRTRDWKLAAA